MEAREWSKLGILAYAPHALTLATHMELPQMY